MLSVGVFPLSLARFRSPTKLLPPGGRPKLAPLLQAIALVELLLSCVAADNGVAVPVDAISEVLTGHADHATLPTLEFLVVDESPFLHNPPEQYIRTTTDGTA